MIYYLSYILTETKGIKKNEHRKTEQCESIRSKFSKVNKIYKNIIKIKAQALIGYRIKKFSQENEKNGEGYKNYQVRHTCYEMFLKN